MKKIVLLSVIVLLLSGAAWGQAAFNPPDNGKLPDFTDSTTFVSGSITGLFDLFYAVPTVSTESRYSAGIFTSMIDNFIDVNNYDPQIGTFAFVGAFPSLPYDPGDPSLSIPPSGGINDTDYLTTGDPNAPNPNYAISFGLGKTIKNYYLGVYYGGSMVHAKGDKNVTAPDTESSEVNWANKLAVLLGTPAYGAFRLDFIMDTSTQTTKNDGDIISDTRGFAPSLALTWGGMQLAGMDPYVTVGYMFPEQRIWGTPSPHKELTYTGISLLGLQAGLAKNFDSTSSLSGDVLAAVAFGGNFKGDAEALGLGGAGKVDQKQDGAFGLMGRAAYKKTMDFGQFAFGFKPRAALGYYADNTGNQSGDTKIDAGTNNAFEFNAGVDLGVRYQPFAKLAFYSGASLQILDWRTVSNSKSKGGMWAVDGFMFSQNNWNNVAAPDRYILGFGTTYTPIKNLVIGAGLNTFTDKLVTFDLTNMTVQSGSWWSGNQNNIGSFAASLFANMTFDLTVSYQF